MRAFCGLLVGCCVPLGCLWVVVCCVLLGCLWYVVSLGLFVVCCPLGCLWVVVCGAPRVFVGCGLLYPLGCLWYVVCHDLIVVCVASLGLYAACVGIRRGVLHPLACLWIAFATSRGLFVASVVFSWPPHMPADVSRGCNSFTAAGFANS